MQIVFVLGVIKDKVLSENSLFKTSFVNKVLCDNNKLKQILYFFHYFLFHPVSQAYSEKENPSSPNKSRACELSISIVRML